MEKWRKKNETRKAKNEEELFEGLDIDNLNIQVKSVSNSVEKIGKKVKLQTHSKNPNNDLTQTNFTEEEMVMARLATEPAENSLMKSNGFTIIKEDMFISLLYPLNLKIKITKSSSDMTDDQVSRIGKMLKDEIQLKKEIIKLNQIGDNKAYLSLLSLMSNKIDPLIRGWSYYLNRNNLGRLETIISHKNYVTPEEIIAYGTPFDEEAAKKILLKENEKTDLIITVVPVNNEVDILIDKIKEGNSAKKISNDYLDLEDERSKFESRMLIQYLETKQAGDQAGIEETLNLYQQTMARKYLNCPIEEAPRIPNANISEEVYKQIKTAKSKAP
jgi:hypothetical protein